MSALELGRGAFRRCAWGEAFVQLSAAGADAGLAVDDFGATGDGGLSPRKGDSVDVWARAYHRCLELGEAARSAGWPGGAWLVRGRGGGAGGGWPSRAQLALDEAGLDGAERGWLLIPQAMASFADDPEAALSASWPPVGSPTDSVTEISPHWLGWGGSDPDLAGRLSSAMPFLDEAMVAVTAGGLAADRGWRRAMRSDRCVPKGARCSSGFGVDTALQSLVRDATRFGAVPWSVPRTPSRDHAAARRLAGCRQEAGEHASACRAHRRSAMQCTATLSCCG